MQKLHLTALVPALALASTSSAAAIVADYGLMPSDNQSTAAIQTFTTDATGGEVGFLLVGGPVNGADGTTGVTAQIFAVTAGGTDGAATVTLGALLDTSDTVDLPATGDHPALATFNFGGDVTLAANTLYAVGFSTDGGSTLADVRVGYAGGSSYSGGESFDAAGDVTFATAFDVSIGFADVPEPGSIALLGLGGLMMLRRRRA